MAEFDRKGNSKLSHRSLRVSTDQLHHQSIEFHSVLKSGTIRIYFWLDDDACAAIMLPGPDQTAFRAPLERHEFKGILLDLDGTIIDSTAAIVKHWHKSVSLCPLSS